MIQAEIRDDYRLALTELGNAVAAEIPGLIVKVRSDGVSLLWPQNRIGLIVSRASRPGGGWRLPSVQEVVHELMVVAPVMGCA